MTGLRLLLLRDKNFVNFWSANESSAKLKGFLFLKAMAVVFQQ